MHSLMNRAARCDILAGMLFDPLPLRGLQLKNRVVVSPMCQYSSEDGFATDWHLVHLGAFAVGGASLVFTEANAVLPEGRISPQDLGFWKDEHVATLARIAQFVHAQGALFGTQLAHAGRKASTQRPWEGSAVVPEAQGGWRAVAPSAVPFRPTDPAPLALDEAGIARVVRAFADAASRALAAGMDVIELHSAHGYLLHEFLSPLANRRADRYGGPLENRARALLEVARAVRKVWPERLPMFVRISATDWAEGGLVPEEAVQVARWLKQEGADLIDCSSGGMVPTAKVPVGPGYQTPFAQLIRSEAGIATGTVGMIRSSWQAEHVLRTGQADVVLLARELLRDARWPLRAAKELGVQLPWPKQYERARD
jgi:2,4-dienoyl-CoA reductase-like NADH-dependent reductase (Old Yellow Enzyme family)